MQQQYLPVAAAFARSMQRQTADVVDLVLASMQEAAAIAAVSGLQMFVPVVVSNRTGKRE